MISRLVNWLIERVKRGGFTRVVTFDGDLLFHRYQPFWLDEWRGADRPPWYRPFNILFHHWQASHREAMHDHPRWSITICLKGEVIEHTPWRSRRLKPGSVVIRSRKYIHAFELPPDAGETWTIFIVGRRNHRQNSYIVTPRSARACGLPPTPGLPEGDLA